MLYAQIIGQEGPKQRLVKMQEEGRVPHALLFSGKEGSGILPTAIAFAQHLFCTGEKSQGACGQCKSCNNVSKLVHPDLHFVFPITKGGDIKRSDDLLKEFRDTVQIDPYLTLEDWFREIDGENKQLIIPVEEANEILRKLAYTSFEGGYKIVIIWCPEKMNSETANKLLKILEEPPGGTIFILVSSQPDSLLLTVRSRLQLVQFYDCSDAEIAEALMQRYHVSAEVAKQTTLLAGGSYSEACKLLKENEESVSFLGNFQNFMRLALRFDGIKALEWVEDNASIGREKQKQFLQYGLAVFRDCLMYNFGEKNLVRLSGQERAFLEKFAPFVNQKNYERLVEEFNSNIYYVERNANPRILFTDLLLTTNELINIK